VLNPGKEPALKEDALAKETWTILKVIRWTDERFQKEGLPTPRLDAEVLLAATLGTDRVRLYTHFDQPLRVQELTRFREMVQRRLKREPVAYILGQREFWSLPFKVTRDVLIPRPETETLVAEAIRLLASIKTEVGNPRVLEIGTGSGAISVALAKELPSLQVAATDVSEKALAIAAENVARNGVKELIRFFRGDLFSPLKKGEKFHLILTNPPYIPQDQFSDLIPEVRDFEPRLALDGGKDGLDFYRRALSQIGDFLFPGGWFLGEIGAGQGHKILQIAEKNPALGEFGFVPDLAGIKRVFKSRRKP
jgi:release factor glutamine methyltransferase